MVCDLQRKIAHKFFKYFGTDELLSNNCPDRALVRTETMMREIPYEERFYVCCCVIIGAYPGRKFMIEPIIQTVNPRKLTDASRLVRCLAGAVAVSMTM